MPRAIYFVAILTFPYRWPISIQDKRYKIGAPEQLAIGNVHGMDVSADGRFVAVSPGEAALSSTAKPARRVPSEPQSLVREMAISPDGSLAVSLGYGSEGFRVWDTKSGKLVHVHRKGLHGRGRFTPDGKHYVSRATGEDLLLWSVADWKLVRKLGPIGAFAISPDSRYLAVVEFNGKARLTRIADGASDRTLRRAGRGIPVRGGFQPRWPVPCGHDHRTQQTPRLGPLALSAVSWRS